MTSSRFFHLVVVQNVKLEIDLGFLSVVLFFSLRKTFWGRFSPPLYHILALSNFSSAILYWALYNQSNIPIIPQNYSPRSLVRSRSHLTWSSTAFKRAFSSPPWCVSLRDLQDSSVLCEERCRDSAEPSQLRWDASAGAQADLTQTQHTLQAPLPDLGLFAKPANKWNGFPWCS